MQVTYSTIEPIEECDIPAWDATWSADEGCNPRYLFSPRYQLVPYSSPQTMYYEPVSIQTIRDPRKMNARAPSGYKYNYFMTPRHVGRIVTKRHLLKRQKCDGGLRLMKQYGHVVHTDPYYCTPTIDYVEEETRYCVYNEVTAQFIGTEYQINGFDYDEVADAYRSIEDDLTVKSRTSYDVLTDIAEAREIPAMVGQIANDLSKILGILRGRVSPRDLRYAGRLSPRRLLRHSKRLFKKLGEEWMAYRYGIMPLMYSYRDILKTIDRGINTSDHCRRTVLPKPTGITLPDGSTPYMWSEFVGSINLRGTVFQHYDLDVGGAQLTGLGLNPFVTAWELIPMSFVVDWFVNVGDYITGNMTPNLAQRTQACISQTTRHIKNTWVYYPADNQSITPENKLPSNWYGPFPPNASPRAFSAPAGSQLLEEVATDTYVRWLVPLSGVQLSLRPYLNWKRGIDAAVIANNLLRSFRRIFR